MTSCGRAGVRACTDFSVGCFERAGVQACKRAGVDFSYCGYTYIYDFIKRDVSLVGLFP